MKISLKYILVTVLVILLASTYVYKNLPNLKKWGDKQAKTLIEEANPQRNHGYLNEAYAKYTLAILLANDNYYKSWAYSCRGLVSWDRYKRWHSESEFNKALYDYNKAIKLASTCYSAAYDNKGLLYKSRKDYDIALEQFDKAIACDSKNSDAYENKISLLFDMGKYEDAIDFGKKGLEKFGQSDDLFFYMAYSYEMLGDYKTAVEYYDKELKYSNYKSWWTFTNASYCKLMLKDWIGAIEYAQRSIKLHQNNVHPYNFVAFAALETDKLDLATEYNNKAFNLYDRPNYMSYYNYARIKHLEGDDAGAKQRLDKARELFEKDTENWQFDGFLNLCDELERKLF